MPRLQSSASLTDSEILIDDELGDEGEAIPYNYSITSYGADYPVDGLVRRMADGDIYIPAFQRSYVWTMREASKFIESLLLGLPVPGIFLSREPSTNKHLVIDGQQRLKTLQYFYDTVFEPTGRRFALVSVQPSFKGATYRTLNPEDQRRLNDSIIHATIVRQDEPLDDDSSVYQIFKRLNTGGRQLQPQEIRGSIYHGPFSEFLKDLNNDSNWRHIYGSASVRLRDQELILRFIALYFYRHQYKRPMEDFLNRYMSKNRNLVAQPPAVLRSVFEPTVAAIYSAIGANAFRPTRALNAAVFDAVMVGVADRVSSGPVGDLVALAERYQLLLAREDFQRATRRATADEESVKTRVNLSLVAFRDIP